MKYKRKNNKNSIEIMNKEKNNLITEDFDVNEYLDDEFIEESKKSFINRIKKQEYEYIIDEDEEEKTTKNENKSVDKKEEKKSEQTKLTIEPIRTVTTEEYMDILKKRQEEKLKQEQKKNKKNNKKNKKQQKKKNKKSKFNIKIVIAIIILLVVFLIIASVVDIISVSKYEKGPYFAIKTDTLNDGGTKIYHGIGYKVIKYNQLQGRRDIEIGSWSLKYDIEPITIEDIDLAIKFEEDETKTFNNLNKKFIRIKSTLKKVNKKNNTITIGYEDEDGKYTLNILCKMADKNSKLDKLEIGKETTIIGTLTNYRKKTSKEPIKVKIVNCFAEQ